MDVCIMGRCQSSIPRTYGQKSHRSQISYTPLVTRRPTSSFANRQAFSPSPRIQSAQPRVPMATPRTQVSMAGFYDWSVDDFDEQPTSTVYQKIAVHQPAGSNKLHKTNKKWCADGVHLNPGRMFVRDKVDLTKGEREIIAGIYKNRGDVNNGGRSGYVAHVRNHRDAWLVGKQMPRKGGNLLQNCEPCSIKVPASFFSKADVPHARNSPREQIDLDYICDKCKDDCSIDSHCLKTSTLAKAHVNNNTSTGTAVHTGRKAPPSTPTVSPKTDRKQLNNNKVNEGAVFIEAGKTFYDNTVGTKKKKVYVDVFLPQFPVAGVSEEVTSLTHVDDIPSSTRATVMSNHTQFIDLSIESPELSDRQCSSRDVQSRSSGRDTSFKSQRSRSSELPEMRVGD